MLADQILGRERTNPDSLLIVLGDFNNSNLGHELQDQKEQYSYMHIMPCPLLHGASLMQTCSEDVQAVD